MPDTITKLTHDSHIQDFVKANREWRDEIVKTHSLKLFTEQSAKGQHPHTMLIACCDSRYNETCFHTLPGEIFTYRVIGNMCISNDLHLMSSMEYGLKVLGVKRIILCGHTDCGAIKTVLKLERGSLLDKDCPYLHSYLADIEDLYMEECRRLSTSDESESKHNVLQKGSFDEQSEYLVLRNLERNFNRLVEMDMVRKAVKEKGVEVYGMIYNVSTGLVETVSSYPSE